MKTLLLYIITNAVLCLVCLACVDPMLAAAAVFYWLAKSECEVLKRKNAESDSVSVSSGSKTA
jgi:hypothetical protein